MNITYSSLSMTGVLAAMIGTDGVFETVRIVLFTDEAPIVPGQTFDDLTEADYDGYAASTAVTWQTPHIDENGNAVVWCLPKEFKPDTDGAEVIVTQVGLINAADELLASYVLEEPISFTTTQDVELIGFGLILGFGSETPEEILP